MAELLDILDSGDVSHLRFLLEDHTGHSEPEGRLFYSSLSKTLVFKNDIADVSLNIGEEMLLRIVNNSGAPILNGRACRHNGVVGGRPQVELALADTFEHAAILGIATHDIADGAEGLLTFMGAIHDVNTSLLPIGQPIYLSSTDPGGFTSVPPEIATQLGGVLVQDASLGIFQVNIRRNINLPNTVGFLQGLLVSPISITTAPLNITGYKVNGGLVMTTDTVLGRVTTNYSGAYRANFSFSGTTTSDKQTLFWELYDVTHDTVLYTYYHPFNKDLTLGQISASFNFPFVLDASAVLMMRVKGSAAFDVGVDNISFDITSIRIAVNGG